ncbi:MAG: ATP-binding protein [Bacteriovoracaceae bacterium]|jgi:AAA+ superfamily predicted ATPase|nr:ATP-binding protein [Bacteriovoracaceae bacterium]
MKKILLLLTFVSSFAAFGDADSDKFLNKIDAFSYWLGEPLQERLYLKEKAYKNFYRLAQFALDDYITNPVNGWVVKEMANFDNYNNRVAFPTDHIETNNFGDRKYVLKQGYYFISKKFGGRTIKLIATPYRISPFNDVEYGVGIYYAEKDFKYAKEFMSDVFNYLTTKNIYKNAVIHRVKMGWIWTYRFLENVGNYKYTWDDLILDPELKIKSMNSTSNFIKNLPALSKYGIKLKRGVVLAGPPGTGKSFLGQILISQILHNDLKKKSTLITVTARHLTDISTVKALFSAARNLSPSIIFMEDIDLLGIKKRKLGGNSSGNKSTFKASILNEFLNEMDGVAESNGVLVIGTTNKEKDLDGALLRSGRLGVHFFYGYPAHGIRKKFFTRYATKGVAWEAGVTTDWLAGLSERLSGADIIEAISMAKQMAYLDDSWIGKDLYITRSYFKKAMATVGSKSEQLVKQNLSYKDALNLL